jgi:hypothetical protein
MKDLCVQGYGERSWGRIPRKACEVLNKAGIRTDTEFPRTGKQLRI